VSCVLHASACNYSVPIESDKPTSFKEIRKK
jgi:hypothetical protein